MVQYKARPKEEQVAMWSPGGDSPLCNLQPVLQNGSFSL